jgi:antitoxin component of RelBE/YafQ-DinJ toxin-antitoxin module
MNKPYSLLIDDLINRTAERQDMPYEFLNKMTNAELIKWEQEVEAQLDAEHVRHFDRQQAFIAKTVDRQILYDLIKLGQDVNKII